MILRILFLAIFIFCSNIYYGQSTKWYLEAIVGAEFSYYESPFNIKKDTFVNTLGAGHSSGFNYQVGGVIGRSINHFVSFESGLHLLIRGDKNIDRTFACKTSEGERLCAGLSESIQKKRYHILEIPLRIKLEHRFSEKYKIHWAGAYSNYLYYATIYDSGSFENIENRMYYAYSVSTNLGLEYQLYPKWRIGVDINARLIEQRQRDEIRFRFGQEEKNYHVNFDNINFGLVLKYQIF